MTTALSDAILPASPTRRPGAVITVFEALRNDILTLDMPPGTVIARTEIARRFGVSPTPVREALLRLAEEGLVDIFPQSRTTVSRIDLQHAREAFVLRLSIDVEVARTLAPQMNRARIAVLETLLRRQAAELDAGDLTAFNTYDRAFHRQIYDFGGVPGLWELVRSRYGHLDRLGRLHLPRPGKPQTILRHHRAIIDALASRDPARAEAAARHHLGMAMDAAGALARAHPDYFL